MRRFGLIGKTLKHSFSQRYFSGKFSTENIKGCQYDLFELSNIAEFPKLLQNIPELVGLNVTLPYKNEVTQFLSGLDRSAEKVEAVNVIKVEGDKLIGFNSDYFGFMNSLENWLNGAVKKALVLGTGGSSKAVKVALDDLDISYQSVSRNSKADCLTYQQLNEDCKLLEDIQLIVNTTPLGMYPNVDDMADIPFDRLTKKHFVYDLVYNPAETKLMSVAKSKGAQVKNGLEMLELQAEKSWEIWNS
ncbi:MAG: shikimate dehydrogenase [Bacteroidota bacterium]